MSLYLHNPPNQAHIEDLKDRLIRQLALAPDGGHDKVWAPTVMSRLVEMVQAMDRGTACERQAREVFSAFHIPGFSFERWLAEMVDEGVYVETASRQAA
ncbi:MAG TPA: hypothetical protein VM899_08685 [Rubellimicrobium sp.]|nr:hypothetical protein [Rubellimicrobium sp.]